MPMKLLHDERLDIVFRAVVECVEEAVLSSMLHAETATGRNGTCIQSLAELLETDSKYSK